MPLIDQVGQTQGDNTLSTDKSVTRLILKHASTIYHLLHSQQKRHTHQTHPEYITTVHTNLSTKKINRTLEASLTKAQCRS